MVDPIAQAAATFNLDLLNLNWSILEADIAFSRSFHRFAQSVQIWTDNDAKAAQAALEAACDVADLIAREHRMGDVMAAVQLERLWILATLLEAALDSTLVVSEQAITDLTLSVRIILESPDLSPIDAAREPLLPPVHRPLLQISTLLLRSANKQKRRDIKVDSFIQTASTFILAAADAAFEAMRQDATAESALVLVAGPLTELIRTGTSTWLAMFTESGLIQRSLDLIRRTTITSGQIPSHIPSILLFHLALAQHPLAAEKLAVSGIIPAYSDNVIAVEADKGDIKPDADALSVHAAWCSMLLVLQNLLATLPSTANFAQYEVAPFVRLVKGQMEKGLSWDAEHETHLTRPALDEMRLTVELLFGLSRAIPGDTTILKEYSELLLRLLNDVRYSLYHPETFAQTIVPASAEEQAELIKELAAVQKQTGGDTVLVKMADTPVLGGRVLEVVHIAQMAMRALIGMTDAWAVMGGDKQPREALVLRSTVSVWSIPAYHPCAARRIVRLCD